MAQTAFATGNALTKKAWEEQLYRDVIKDSYFSRLMGTGTDSCVQVKTDLEKGKGDKVNFGVRMRLSAAGVTSGSILEGNEEALTTYASSVTLEQYRHAVRDDGAMSRQRVAFSISKESEQAIKDWGTEKIDNLAITALLASPTKILYPDGTAGAFTGTGTAATAKSALVAANSKLTTGFISACRVWAKTGGGRSGSQIPLRPIKVEGKDYYVLLVHPDCLYDLKVNSTFQNAMRDARERSASNPLFQGATAIWDQVVIHEHEDCTAATDAGASSNVAWAKGAFMGAQALAWAWGERPEVVMKKFDYDNQVGYAWGMIAGVAKPSFNSTDYGSIGIYLARTNVSGQ